MKNFLSISLIATSLLFFIVPVASASAKNSLLNNESKLEEIAKAFDITLDTLIEEIKDGNTIKEIGIAHDVTKGKGDSYMQSHPITDDQIEQIAEELDVSVDEIKEAIGNKKLRFLFKENGVDMPSFMQSIGAVAHQHHT